MDRELRNGEIGSTKKLKRTWDCKAHGMNVTQNFGILLWTFFETIQEDLREIRPLTTKF